MYIFANQSGPIPLNELDANFAETPNYANTAGAVTTNAQPNITSVGNLTSLSVTGNITGSNISMSIVNGSSLIGTIITASQTNITALGELGTLSVVGNVTGGNITSGGKVTAAALIGTINTNAQPYITSVGTLNSLVTSGNVTVGRDLLVLGNALIQGTTTTVDTQTLNVDDLTITVGNNVSTSALINGAGIEAGNPAVAYIKYSDPLKAWTTANNVSIGGNLTVSGRGTVTGVLLAPTAPNNTSNTQVATTEFVRNNGVPSGCILMWSGSIASIPTGWYLCDGNNGTPNLLDRFIIAAGNAYSVGSTGGSTDSIVISHTHTASTIISDSGHSHIYPGDDQLTAASGLAGWTATSAGSFNYDASSRFSGGAQMWYTTSSNTGVTASTTVASTGSSGTGANMPPYYALAFIMKA